MHSSTSSSSSSLLPPPPPAPPSSASTPSLFSNLPKESRNLYCVLVTSLVALLLILSFSSPSPSSAAHLRSSSADEAAAVAGGLLSSSPAPPSLAYLLTGSDGDGDRLVRLLLAVYHPKNIYLLHLDGAAPQEQREQLALAVRAVPAFRSARNVHVVGKPDFVNPRGSSLLSATLHGAAILLRIAADWDWFVNLDASDYPLVTQDDLLHVFSFLPKDLNFVQHSSYIGWRESRRVRPIIVDPGLYLSSRNDVFYATQKRELPNAYRLFTGCCKSDYKGEMKEALAAKVHILGVLRAMVCYCVQRNIIKHDIYNSTAHIFASRKMLAYRWSDNCQYHKESSASVILSRKFVEYCILGTDNLARTLLMYYANTPSSHTDYFQTVLCNSPGFNKTIVNHQLHYMVWDTSNKKEPRDLTLDDFNNLTLSGAVYGTRFAKDDPVLNHIDKEVLNRNPGTIVPGGWCLGGDSGDPCRVLGNVDVLSPGPGSTMLSKLIAELLSEDNFHSQQCIWY